jgi:hypothetical protein
LRRLSFAYKHPGLAEGGAFALVVRAHAFRAGYVNHKVSMVRNERPALGRIGSHNKEFYAVFEEG